MTKEEASVLIFSDSADKRLEAARFFSRMSDINDAALLSKAVAKENVRWVKRALERAIDRIQAGPKKQNVESEDLIHVEDDSNQLLKDLRAQAIDEVSKTILHEFSPLIGTLRLVTEKEIESYEISRTKHCVERLNGLLEAVKKLKKAAATPSYSDFDLSELVAECIAVLDISSDEIVIRIAGIRPYIVHADRGSLGLAIDNGIRNAIEAVRDFSTLSPAEILINWGPAGKENWLAILDCGAGFVGNPEDSLKLGASNKKEHFGYGLTTAQLSMRSMEGEVIISNKAEGGARFELRWYRDYANFIR